MPKSPAPRPAIPQEVFDLYDAYAHNRLDRRGFVRRLGAFAVGGLTVPTLLSAVMPDYAAAVQVPEDDPRLITETIAYDSPAGAGQITAQLSRPAPVEGAAVAKTSNGVPVATPLPGIVVVHENRGLNPYVADVGRRAALAGFVSIAPDALSPLGGYPGNDDEGRALQRTRDREEMLRDFIAAHDFLAAHPATNGRVGVVGFCFGGWVCNAMATRVPALGAAVPFYGSAPELADVPAIRAPLMLHFGGLDERVNAQWPTYEAALMAHQKAYSAHFYPEVNHGFHNDSTPRFDEGATALAWARTTAFFEGMLA